MVDGGVEEDAQGGAEGGGAGAGKTGADDMDELCGVGFWGGWLGAHCYCLSGVSCVTGSLGFVVDGVSASNSADCANFTTAFGIYPGLSIRFLAVSDSKTRCRGLRHVRCHEGYFV